MPGAANVELLKKIIPENELWPPKPGTSWQSHHAFGAWVGDTWLMKDLLASYFGEAGNLEELVAQSQWMQTDGALTELPATLPDDQFASTAHLTEGGARAYTERLALALKDRLR